MMEVVVSVIIPFLNRSEWLMEAVTSVKQQTFVKWELLLIDDGSLPQHSSVAKSLADNKKIFYYDHAHHENRGVSISRNLGVANANGNYIAFLDADDCWLPQKLDRQLKLFAEHDTAEMICEGSLFWNSWKDGNEPDEIVAVGAPANTLFFPPELATILYPLNGGAPPCPSGIIVTKKAFDRVGGFETSFTGDLQLYEDQGFLSKIYLNENVFVSGQCNNKYRKHAGSITQSGNDPDIYLKSRRYFLNWLEKYSSDKRRSAIHKAIANARARMNQ